MVSILSLRFKLGLIHGLVIALIILAGGLICYQVLAYRSQKAFEAHLLHDAEFFLSHVELSSDGFRYNTWGMAPRDALTVLELAECFVLTDSQGKIYRSDFHSKYVRELLSDGSLEHILRRHSGFVKVRAADDSSHLFVTLSWNPDRNGRTYFMHIGRPFDPLDETLREYLFIYIVSTPLILGLAVLVGWYLVGRALGPFEEVAQTAERITSMNLNTRISTERREREIMQLVDSFNSMIGRLHESFEQMRKFNADAAHELRTPLAILQGETEIALGSSLTEEELRSVLESNLEELERLTRIINDMLVLAEAEAGSQVLAMRPMNLKPMLEDLVEQMRLLAMDHNVAIDLCELSDATIDGDELWIRRALLNLLDNAIKYSREGGKVRVSIDSHDSWVRLRVSDDGIGIAVEDLPHIFDRLYRADPARSRANAGAGLGLSLVKWIIEQHRGRIAVESRIDQGTCFEIQFPVSGHGDDSAAEVDAGSPANLHQKGERGPNVPKPAGAG